MQNLLTSRGIDYLTVTGRTKERAKIVEKITRKGYKDPRKQLTDLTGVRVIVFFESQVEQVSGLINEAFNVDLKNSLNKDAALSVDQTGYRSVHFVCDLGETRLALPEFVGLSELKFEFQVRTLLQHAWAELAHDRNYKFSGKLPREMERQLYLYAGMLEIADKGFDKLSKDIDRYAEDLRQKAEIGDLTPGIDSISLQQFIDKWSKENGVELTPPMDGGASLSELASELISFGIGNLYDLNSIIPEDYAGRMRSSKEKSNIYGVVRDWMLIKDWRSFKRDVKFNWIIEEGGDDNIVLMQYIPQDDLPAFFSAFRSPEDEEQDEDDSHAGLGE
jgi:ppGpp synthetase/RelA/SpoT-type nucleotidyltranferase